MYLLLKMEMNMEKRDEEKGSIIANKSKLESGKWMNERSR